MENSLQDTAGSFSFCGMKKHAISLISLLISIFLIPVPAAAEPVCEGNQCTITFGYTGTMQTWEVPQGAINLSFEIYGASGARGGGGGGVTGNLVNLPETLYIFVGGAGSQGVTAAGGYNGGGRAGGNRGNEGSGGGATDIRLGVQLEDRIVVAGGGGGGGGYSGASGAAGGGLTANSGASGQGGGGGGGTQTSGGGAGYSNGGSAASAGSFGQGGQGGTSWNAGGGGGGGGWYGGGGGGGDDDDCCADGGGGGGGSSYTADTHTNNVEHQIGVNSGHGRLVISYSLAPNVISFVGEQLSAQTVSFTLEVSEAIFGLSEDDFTISSQSCAIAAIVTDGPLANVELSGCDHGEISLTLLPFTIGDGDTGPTEAVTASIFFDGQGPTFEWQEHARAISSSTTTIAFTVSDQVEPVSDSFAVLGCQLAVSSSAVILSSCSHGIVQLSLRAMSLEDSWGNLAPLAPISLSFEVDMEGPVASWSEIQVAGDGPFSYSAVLSFSEPVSFSPAVVSFSSSVDCSHSYELADIGWVFSADCGYGSGTWSLVGSDVPDLLGNYSQQGSIEVSFDNPKPQIPQPVAETPEESEVTPVTEQPAPVTPQPAPSVPLEPVPPVAPEPAEENPLTESETLLPATESDSVEPATASDTVSPSIDDELLIEKELARQITSLPRPLKPERQVVEPERVELEPQPLSSVATESKTVSPPLITEPPQVTAEPVIFEGSSEEPIRFPWQAGLAVLAVIAAGVVTFRLSGR